MSRAYSDLTPANFQVPKDLRERLCVDKLEG